MLQDDKIVALPQRTPLRPASKIGTLGVMSRTPLPYKTRLELLESLYAAAFEPELWPAFLEQVSRATEGPRTALILADPKGQGAHTVSLAPGFDDASLRLYERYYHSRNIWWERKKAFRGIWVGTSQELCSINELHRSEFHTDFLRHIGIEHSMFMLLSDARLQNLCIYRGADQKPFEAEDLQLLHFLVPHLRRAFRLHFLVDQQKSPETKFDLTPAERRVALLLRDGKSPKDIAQILAISPHTVKGHLAHIYNKTDTSRQAQLVRLLLQRDIC